MTFHSARRRGGFTLIELIVVIAILATLVGISAPALYSHMKAGDVTKCRTQIEQLSKLGIKYSQDMAHKALLPTSGMEDDEDTKDVNESDGWWIAVAPELDSTVYPRNAKGKMKVSTIFHCPSDMRTNVGSDSMMLADVKSVSYVSWTDGTEDRDNPNSCIRTTARQNLDTLPWLSDGNPVKGQSVTDLASFRKMVIPALERHDSTIVVAYASGAIKAVKVEDDENVDAEALFKRIAPTLANKKKDDDDSSDSEDTEDEEDDVTATGDEEE